MGEFLNAEAGMDPLLAFLIVVIIVAVIVSFLPIEDPMKGYIFKGIAFVGCIVLLVWVLTLFGLMPHGVSVPR